MTACCANGWTGGQYSVFRFTLGSYLLIHFACLVSSAPEISTHPTGIVALLLAGVGLSALFALGIRDRFAVLALLSLGIGLFAMNPPISNTSMPFIALILFAHTFVPTRPYGSWDARGRIDPGAGWRLPTAIHTAAWIALAIGYAYSGFTKLGDPAWIDGSALLTTLSDPLAAQTLLGELALLLPPPLLALATWSVLALEISFAPLAILRKVRPWLWLALLGVQFSLMALGHFADNGAGMLMLHFLAFDPAWVKGIKEQRTATIFYDGGCGLCHRFVRFALAEDAEGRHFRFAPLESGGFYALRKLSPQAELLDSIDSVVLSLPNGDLLVRAAATLEIGKRLGGIWRVAAIAACAVPLGVLDAAYDGIAKIRHRIFATPAEACPILPAQLRDRFDDD
ncbi:MAG: DUF393 domain-containing protein [Deltaproteobacteria bacterium]|nr:DUF393 domain-containing protein [Deltaproteobacteria bacterium]